MSFNPMKWKAGRVGYVLLSVFIFYVLFVYKRTHQVIFEATIDNTDPIQVWEFVADFSNMKKLNPTIEDFSIIAESGNYDHWKYSVKYTEHLSQIPLIRNTAHGHYAVRPDKNGYLISSRHHTCFLFDLHCLESVSQFRFDPDGTKDTRCIETVQYECPVALTHLCHEEVMYQRREIMDRLKTVFSVEDRGTD